MKKAECIERYGEEEWDRRLEQGRGRELTELQREKDRKRVQEWALKNPDKATGRDHEANRKGGKYYDYRLEYQRTGLRGERNRIRVKHGTQYRPYKKIIAPDSQIHHEWIPKTAEYRGVALVEKEAHLYGIIDVILILDGKITLLTEEDVKMGKGIKL